MDDLHPISIFFIALAPLVRYDEERDQWMPTDQAVYLARGNRRARFRELNNRIWGEGNWIVCPTCPRDSNGFEVFHHKNVHTPVGRIGVAMEHSIEDPFTGEITVDVRLD